MSTDMTMEKDIVREMKGVGVKLSKEMLSKCMAIATNHRLDPTHMATAWEALALNKNYDSLTETTFASFRAALLNNKKTTTTTTTTSSGETKKSMSVTPIKRPKAAVVSRPAFSNRIKSEFDDVAMATPEKKRKISDDDLSTPPHSGKDSKEGIVPASSSSSAIVTPSTVRKPLNIPSYANRKNAGQTVVSYNPKNLSSSSSSSSPGVKCTIDTQPYGTNVSGVYRHMTDRKRNVNLNTQLEERMRDMVKLFNIPTQNMHGDDDFEQQNNNTDEKDEHENDKNAWPPLEYVGIPRPTPQTNIGRICNEAHTGKLNATSILLEGCFTGSHGARIELDISQLSNVSLFPGQIVAVAGYNSSGRRMVVQRLAEGTEMEMGMGGCSDHKEKKEQEGTGKFAHATTMTKDLHHLQYGMELGCQRGEPIQIMTVAGPYTTNDDTSYQPFIDLLEVIMKGTNTDVTEPSPPDVVILMGPYVDMRQKMVSEGTGLTLEYENDDGTTQEVHVSHEHFFAHKIARELEMLYEESPDLKTQFVIVPSMDDAVSEPVFPQPPLEDALPKGGKVMKLFAETDDTPFGSLCLNRIESIGRSRKDGKNHHRRIHLVSNPATITVNEVTIGFTSTDSFLHLSTESVNQSLPPGTRLARLSQHVLQQQSYYPVYPPPMGGGRELNLDVTQMDKYRIPIKPDVLILPSRLTPMAMNLNTNSNNEIESGTVVVNPGLLVKGTSGGTFAIMDIHPMKKDDLNVDSEEERKHLIQDRIKVEVRRI